MTAVAVISLIASLLGPIIDMEVNKIKNKQNVTIDNLRSLISAAFSKAQNLGNNKIEQLNNKLTALPFIQRTPALMNAIDNAYDGIRNKISELRSDIVEAEVNSQKLINTVNQAENANVFERADKISKAEEEVNNGLQKITKIEEKL